ncbi:MAG: hypothetical protein WBF06_07060 [Candidatus Acidiferrales bacterium]
MQAVPLTVTGVDALGRPFQERTSTQIINCQGCRYQSKHYVLKNMWLTFEVPHPETGRPPRTVRARVTWVQRPRTVRELFQIGAELETSGNVWGVAFPPSDWTPFPDGARPETPARSIASSFSPSIATSLEATISEQAEASSIAPQEESPAAAAPPEPETVSVESAERPAEHEPESRADAHIHVMPSPASADESLQLARQMSRLMNEARQQLQETVNTQATQAVSAELRSLLLSIENQLQNAAEKSVRDAATTHGEVVLRSALENISQGEIERLSARWAQEADRHLRGGIGRLSSEIDQVERRRREELEAEIHARFDQARAEIENAARTLEAESSAAQTRLEQWRRESEETATASLRRWTEIAESSSAQALARMTELEAAAARVAERMAAATSEAESVWRGRLEADVATANARVHEHMESSLETAARQAAERLAHNSESSAQELERHIAQRIETLTKAFNDATAEAESALGTLRASLSKETGRANAAVSQLNEAAAKIENHGATLDGLRQNASEELERHGQALVESHSVALNQRAETIANSVVERLEPGLIAAGRELLSSVAQQIEQQFAPQLDRASATLRELEAGSARAEEALAAHEQRVREISERSASDAAARTEEIFRRLEERFQQSSSEAQARSLADLEARATDTTHNAFESIFKSADWYEKKVQTQMQSTLEKGIAQAADALRDKAAELSGIFAAELDHFTRSYVEQAKEQLDDQARVAAERTREAAEEASDAVAGGFSERAAKIAAEQYQRLVAQSAAAQEHFSARLDAQAAETQSQLDAAAQLTAEKFRADIEKQSAESIVAARGEIDAQAEAVTEYWRAARNADVQEIEKDLARMGNQAVEDYKQRLENNSNTWELASVTKLNQHSQDLIDQLAVESEDRIRAACSGIFAEIGVSMRQRILRSPEPESHTKPEPKSAPDSTQAPDPQSPNS